MAIQKRESTAAELLEGAQDYCDSMETLFNSANNSSVNAIGLLASHSLEIALKAFLLTQEWSEKRLRNELGHDLTKAWVTAVDNGLPISHEIPYWVKVLSLGHDFPFIYRYPQKDTAIAIPTAEDLVTHLQQVIQLVKRYSEQTIKVTDL